MKKFLPFLILISALAVSGSAAFYSIYGLGKLFAGASLQVMIMAATLEAAKLVVATALHRYWAIMNKLMKFYLTLAVVVLIGITSAGIYGFLSSSYQVTAAKDAIVVKKIEILKLKKERFDQQRTEYRNERDQVITSITDLRKSISNPNQVQYVDRQSGQLVTTTSSSARKSLETQLEDAISRRDQISQKIEAVTDSLTSLDVAIVEVEANSDTSTELGPLKYLSGLTGKPMDIVVNWFLMLLIFVFDPLAVTLIILANFAFERAFGKHAIEAILIRQDDDTEIDTQRSDESGDNSSDDSGTESGEMDVQEVTEVIPTITVREVKEPDVVVVNGDEEDEPKRKILNTDINSDVAKHILDALPWARRKNRPEVKAITPEERNSEPKEPILDDRQKANMTHQEIMEWYKKNVKSDE